MKISIQCVMKLEFAKKMSCKTKSTHKHKINELTEHFNY